MKSYHSIVVPIRLATAVSLIARNRSRSECGNSPDTVVASLAMCFPLLFTPARAAVSAADYSAAFTSAAPAASARSLPSAARRDSGNMPQSVQA